MTPEIQAIIRATAKIYAGAGVSNTYDISAEVQTEGSKVIKITDGRVMLADVEVAAFNVWKDGKVSVAFNGADRVKNQSIVAEIYSFIDAVTEKVNTNPISL